MNYRGCIAQEAGPANGAVAPPLHSRMAVTRQCAIGTNNCPRGLPIWPQQAWC